MGAESGGRVCYRCFMTAPWRGFDRAREPAQLEAGGQRRTALQPELGRVVLAVRPAPVSGGAENQESIAADYRGQSGSPHRIPRWLVRLELFLRVMLRMYIGIAVCYAPWSHTFWDQNPVFVQFPTLAIYAANGAVRGIVSGLGLLNLWFAIQDALQHHDG